MPLGRGLESLIPNRKPDDVGAFVNDGDDGTADAVDISPPPPPPAVQEEAAPRPAPASYEDHFTARRGDSIFWIEIDKIEPNPYQPRREFAEEALKDLAGSIREHGILQPILVTKQEIETPGGLDVRYQLIAGERRWRASRLAGLSQIPAVIRRGMPDDRVKLELALIENVQREDLNVVERAVAFKQLADEFHLVQREIGERVGKSREAVANTMRLLTLPQEIIDALRAATITEGHARAILMAGEDAAKQMDVFRAVVVDRLTVRETENRARQVTGRALVPKPKIARVQDPEMRTLESRLQERLGTKVELQRVGSRGKIVVEFYSEEELREILAKMMQEGARTANGQSSIPEPPSELPPQEFSV